MVARMAPVSALRACGRLRAITPAAPSIVAAISSFGPDPGSAADLAGWSDAIFPSSLCWEGTAGRGHGRRIRQSAEDPLSMAYCLVLHKLSPALPKFPESATNS